jgi:hypothetical protein
LKHELLPKAPGYYGEMVWVLMMLEQWLRGWETRGSTSHEASHATAHRPGAQLAAGTYAARIT